MKLSNFVPNEFATMYGTKMMLLEPGDGSTRKFFGTDLGDLYPEGIPDGGLSGTFIYIRAEETGAPADGWYLDDEGAYYNFDHPMDNFELPFGFGFMCECTDFGAGFTEAGAVTQEDYELELDSSGKQIIGNASVLPKTLADFIPNDFVTMYGTKLMLLEPGDGSTRKFFGSDLGDLYPEGIPDGGLSATFIYIRAEETGAPADGWYLDDEGAYYNFDHPMNEYVVAPGTGFMCECTDYGATIEIPGSL